MQPSSKIIEIVKELDDQFWDTYNDSVDNFPDTDEGVDAKFLILNAAITSIMGNYIIAFDPEYRVQHLENLIQHMRTLEIQVRDYKLPE